MRLKFICFIVLAMLFKISGAQTFGIKGGMNIASMSFSASGLDFSPKSIVGVHVGPVVEFKMQGSLSFNTGLLYSLKGYKMKADYMGTTMEGTSKINYLEVPMNLVCKFPTSETSNFLIQAGPYLGYALSGKDETDGETTDVEFGDGGMKRFDFGLGIGLGLEFGPLVPTASYQFGLANLSGISDLTVKNNAFMISVAYMFGGK
jgi:hypothetical protein